MDALWNNLQFLSVSAKENASPLATDRAYAKTLNDVRIGGDWQTFYEAIAALEHGCGFQPSKMVKDWCKAASLQDDKRLLQIIEQKSRLFDLVFCLHNVEPDVKLAWISDGAFTSTFALFECLRQLLTEDVQNEATCDVLIKGLCGLLQLSQEHFYYLLRHYILYQNNMIALFSRLLKCLPKSGWLVLTQCVSFDSSDLGRMQFWNQAAESLNWNTVYSQAEPLLESWEAYIKQSLPGHYRQSLFSEVSNLLVGILACKLDTPEQCLTAMEQAVCAGETAMYRWYERETQQFGALITCLSIIEHLRLVWIKNSAAYAKPFPDELRCRCLALISQWRYLWVTGGKEQAEKEIVRLENWLLCKQ